ncbi:cell division protein FtsI/penicillin-binding protein 2 [Bacillus sp. SORGH_AS 510]|uniref:peptidoglycan D,D-transpeptidase FtsI family protein n=1 Tax=Bacillus sp. SORGH_AS_0510 TaxID=3041771 RepID=UPI0027870EFE|nr:penicillin-binding protein 2 [Bacillus sp. SORGH_AS_0510]MDQ1146403.1 cell division protein FtsI/penicillin-binding protein 2 [Bacillus sp. SORGH_AS_0510]
MEKPKKKKSHFPFRLNILFFSVFLLFSILILRLGFVQIVHGENFKRDLERKEDIIVSHPVPRGKMFDRDFKVVVDNIPKSAITFTNEGFTQAEMLDTAEKLAQFIEKDTKKVTKRDMQDFWMMKHSKIADAKITKKEKALYEAKQLSDKDLYRLKLSRITDPELQTLTTDDLEVLAIYREFISGYKFTPQIVKNENVSEKEFAVVSENLQSLPGVETTTDWDRSYGFNETLRSVLGKVTKPDEGLPADQLDYFLARGYSRNDRVGKSQLEMQYEDVLHGYKSKIKNITDKTGSVIETQPVTTGKKGKDLVLTIDMDLQMAVDKIIEEELWAAKKSPGTALTDRAYVVLMDPHTGEILAMSGKKIVKNSDNGKVEMIDDALGTFTTTYNVGSAVKGATILTGYKTGAISPGTVFDDTGIKIKDTPIKKSYSYLGRLNEIDALKKSSNVYMFHTAIRIGKGHYEYDKPLNFTNPKAFETIRNSFASFGLGTRTGIDLPNEQSGFKGQSRLPGYLLDLVIGQYDTYSAMQLAQYVSTIANGGYRMQPHIVKQFREPASDGEEVGAVSQEISPVVLNTIDAKKQWMDRVQSGFRKVMQEPGGTATKFFTGVQYSPAGKTGTAEAFYDGPLRSQFGKEPPPVMNLSLVSYAPSNNPEVAMAVIVPWAYQGTVDNRANLKIGRKVLDTYFQLKNK